MYSFESILRNCLKSGKEYRQSPPQGPPDEHAVLSEEAQKATDYTEHGEDPQADRGKVYSSLRIPEGEDVRPVFVESPSVDDLADIHVCGIDGSNQRVQKSAFQFILARACIIAFRYSSNGEKPYFHRHIKNAEGVVWVDGNIFDGDSINIRTAKPSTEEGELVDIMDALERANKPMMMRYKRGEMKKSPSGYSLGVAVKMHQALELLCVKEAPIEAANMVCIKDGPLLPTSTSRTDTKNGLLPIFSWKQGQVLIACSKRVGGSPLLLETLLCLPDLREIWFKPGQRIVDSTLHALASDANLLNRILKPGQRTPFIEAVPIARSGIVSSKKGGEERLTPLSCYYMSRSRPHTYVRMEVPRCMWESDREGVSKAVKIAAWQHELGRRAPLVQLEADKQCDLSAERRMLELQTARALAERNLDLLEGYDG